MDHYRHNHKQQFASRFELSSGDFFLKFHSRAGFYHCNHHCDPCGSEIKAFNSLEPCRMITILNHCEASKIRQNLNYTA